MSIFVLDGNILAECSVNMDAKKLKELRKQLGTRQKDLAQLLNVLFRTYQNWGQPEGSPNHRQIPPEYADKITVLSELKGDNQGHFPADLQWIRIPLRPDESKELETRAEISQKNLPTLVREAIFKLLENPY